MDMTNTKPFQITITSFLHCDSAVDDTTWYGVIQSGCQTRIKKLFQLSHDTRQLLTQNKYS